MVRYFPILGFGPVLGLGFRVRNLEKKRKRNWTCSIWVLSVLKVFWGVGVGHVVSCTGGSCRSVFS